MEIEGIITSGIGKGTYFMSQEFYSKQFQEKLNFTPFIGTLNIKIDAKGISRIIDIPHEKFGIIIGKGDLGDVKFINAVLNDKIHGALVFPAKTQHTEDVLEFIAAENLRDILKLEDMDHVTLRID
jgi:riboflavin kinase, archaea type